MIEKLTQIIIQEDMTSFAISLKIMLGAQLSPAADVRLISIVQRIVRRYHALISQKYIIL